MSAPRRYLRARARPAARRKAARLLFADRLTDQAIAEVCGVSRRQLARWKHEPGFIALLQKERAAWEAERERARAAEEEQAQARSREAHRRFEARLDARLARLGRRH